MVFAYTQGHLPRPDTDTESGKVQYSNFKLSAVTKGRISPPRRAAGADPVRRVHLLPGVGVPAVGAASAARGAGPLRDHRGHLGRAAILPARLSGGAPARRSRSNKTCTLLLS